MSLEACSLGQCEVYLKLLQAVIAESHILLQLGVVLLQLGVVLLCLLVQLSKAGHLRSSTQLPQVHQEGTHDCSKGSRVCRDRIAFAVALASHMGLRVTEQLALLYHWIGRSYARLRQYEGQMKGHGTCRHLGIHRQSWARTLCLFRNNGTG